MLRIMAIDLGLVRVATVVDNIGNDPVAYAGGPMIEMNHWYNKEMARLKSEQFRCTPRIIELQRKFSENPKNLTEEEWKEWKRLTKNTPKMKELTEKRNNKIKDYYHKLSKNIVNEAANRSIDIIVIGHNPGQKQNINLGDKTNQKFVQLPNFKMISMLRYKAEISNIVVIDITEEFTSKASFIDGDIMPDRSKVNKKANGHSDVKFSGKRSKRGCYITSDGTLIHADVNGAYNILKKAFPDAFASNGMAGKGNLPRGCRLHPLIRVIPVS